MATISFHKVMTIYYDVLSTAEDVWQEESIGMNCH
jgi:hypothetical protein